MKIVIVGAGSRAFSPALLGGFSADRRYEGATIGLVDVDEQVLGIIARLAQRVSDERGMHWKIESSAERRDVLPNADIVTTSVAVGGWEAGSLDVDIPLKYGFMHHIFDTSGPGGLGRALRHIPVMVGVARDMEQLCPNGTFFNFSNPLTVVTQAVNNLTEIPCIGLCIGVDLTWRYLCRVMGIAKHRTSILAGGINHCHWILDMRIDGQDAFPLLDATLDEIEGETGAVDRIKGRYPALAEEPKEELRKAEPLCAALYRQFGAYPGPGDSHISEFFPQLCQSTAMQREEFARARAERKNSGHAYHDELLSRMRDIADGGSPLDEGLFGKELAFEHTQLMDVIASRQDNLGQTFYINIPNRGYVHNLPEGVVVETPVKVDAAGYHPFAVGDLPLPILPTLMHKVASLDLIIEAAMEGSRRKAVQAMINDPYCTDMGVMERCVNELIDAELKYLPNFR